MRLNSALGLSVMGGKKKKNWIRALDHNDSWAGIGWHGFNVSADTNSYLYGTDIATAKYVKRGVETSQTTSNRIDVTTIDASFLVNRVYTTSTPDLIFVLVYNTSTNVYYLLRSADGGSTCSNVLTFGAGNGVAGADVSNVKILDGFCEVKTALPGGGGTGTLLIGEYNNTGLTRTAGGTNDRVRILKSTDNGEHWSVIMNWNTDGANNNVKHIHSIKQDPYSGYVYITTGDANAKAGIIRWDGATAWTDNLSIAGINAVEGFKSVTGSQRHRTVGMIFTSGYMFTFTDSNTSTDPSFTEQGIWKVSKDLQSWTRVDNSITSYDPMHVGWYGENINGTLIWTTAREYVNGTYAWAKQNILVYASMDNGKTWKAFGEIRLTGTATASVYMTAVFQMNGKLFIDCTASTGGFGGSNSYAIGTIYNFNQDRIILHPVYYLGTWGASGSDANSGRTPSAPKLTLKSMLEGNAVCCGARVRAAAGTFAETGIIPDWSSATKNTVGKTLIEGAGASSTKIYRSASGTAHHHINLDVTKALSTAESPVVFKNMNLYNLFDSAASVDSYILKLDSGFAEIQSCTVGNILNDNSPLAIVGSASASGNLTINASNLIENTNVATQIAEGSYGSNVITLTANAVTQYTA